jgi:hypothetical protein
VDKPGYKNDFKKPTRLELINENKPDLPTAQLICNNYI